MRSVEICRIGLHLRLITSIPPIWLIWKTNFKYPTNEKTFQSTSLVLSSDFASSTFERCSN